MIVDGVCTIGDLPPESCGHCRGISTPNLDGIRVPVDPDAPPFLGLRQTSAMRERTARVKLSKLGRLLVQTADVYAQLGDALHGTRGGGEGDRVSGGGGDDKPMPLQHQVAEHRHLLVRGLRHWCAQVHATPRVLVSEDVPRMVAWLASEAGQLSEFLQAELEDNLLDWLHRARTLTDLPKLRGTIPLPAGTCPNRTAVEDVELWACGGQLSVLLPADKGTAPFLRCKDCKARWDVADLPAAADVRLPLSAAAEVTGTSVRTLQYRVQHGQLSARAGTVLLGDVLRSQCALSR